MTRLQLQARKEMSAFRKYEYDYDDNNNKSIVEYCCKFSHQDVVVDPNIDALGYVVCSFCTELFVQPFSLFEASFLEE